MFIIFNKINVKRIKSAFVSVISLNINSVIAYANIPDNKMVNMDNRLHIVKFEKQTVINTIVK